jgi:predicted lipoprotein with Yx(FWY)xxD motif
MKLIKLATAALLFSAASAFAAEPAKVADGAGGKIYTDQNGMTLYTFDKDSAGKSNCDGDCAAKWPPFMAVADAAPEGDWTIVERTDGSKMWAYDGKPLYTWVNDKAAGDTTGDGVGGVWHVARPK